MNHSITERKVSGTGMALVVTLAFLVMITILVVGMAASMRLDRAAASSHLERTRAELLAHTAVDKVMATLRRHTADIYFYRTITDATNPSYQFQQRIERYWVSQPGQLLVAAETDNPATNVDERLLLTTAVPLSSGLGVPGSSSIFDPPNLNINTFHDPDHHLLTDLPDSKDPNLAAQIRLAWVYIRKDGTLDFNREPDLTLKSNPIVGRYAYWTDDESSKVNYNIAWGRHSANTNLGAHPSKIDLTALPNVTEPAANALRSFILSGTTNLTGPGLMPSYPLPPTFHFFNSPEDARRVGLSGTAPDLALSEALAENRFDLTHYNHDPGTTFFGDDRILLTTNRNLVPHTVARDVNGNPIPDPLRPGKHKIVYLRKFLDLLRDDLPPECRYPTESDAITAGLDPKRYPAGEIGELDPGNILHHLAGQYDFTSGYKVYAAPHTTSGYPYNTGQNAPGILSEGVARAERNKLDTVLREMMNYVTRRDWPFYSNGSFQDKFYPGTRDWKAFGAEYDISDVVAKENWDNCGRMTQIAVNLLGYVCAKESTGKRGGGDIPPPWPWPGVSRTDNAEIPYPGGLTSPIRFGLGDFGGPKRFSPHQNYINKNGSAFESPSRMPLLTEMGMWMQIPSIPFQLSQLDPSVPLPPPPPTPPSSGKQTLNKYKFYLRAELYLPPSYGIKGINLCPGQAKDGELGWFIRFAEMDQKSNLWFTTRKDNTVPIYGPQIYYIVPDGRPTSPDGKTGTLRRCGIFTPNPMRIYPHDIVDGTQEDGTGPGTGTWLRAGHYVTIEKPFYRDGGTGPEGAPSDDTSFRFRNYIGMTAGLYVGRSGSDAEPAKVERTSADRTYSDGYFIHKVYGYDHPIVPGGTPPVKFWISISQKPDPTLPQPPYAYENGNNENGVYVVSDRSKMRTIEIDDPRGGLSVPEWKYSTGDDATDPKKRNSFGKVNSISSLGRTAAPSQDADASGKITDASLYMPPPAGQKYTPPGGVEDDNTLGRVTSLGELGYIHTGIDGHAPAGGVDCNVPWRTLRLQPNNDAAGSLPDWAFLDLFAVPQINSSRRIPNTACPIVEDSISDPTSEFYTPWGTNFRGRVNLNTRPRPFDLERKGALAALLTGARTGSGSKVTPAEAKAIANNIYNRFPATGGKSYGQTDVYDSPGEICEIKGIADRGEASEDLVREIGSLTTARGEVFSIYTIGQTLKQTPDGKLKITAEQRQQAMVERYLDHKGTLIDPNESLPMEERIERAKLDDQLRMRTIYCRNLNP